ncbi:hypothetical protein AN958_04405, partial [Leucoagaricus sp. SymC.cos]
RPHRRHVFRILTLVLLLQLPFTFFYFQQYTGHDDGKEVVHGDVLLDRGLVVEVGNVSKKDLDGLKYIKVVDAKGRWITPGLVNLHSHIGVDSAPHLDGAADTNLRKASILPWLRSPDGIDTHDQAFELTVSGGVTTAQVLPGSANDIGGPAFVIKLRPTDKKSTMSKVVEPPQTLIKPPENVTHVHWRHMKHACSENPDRVYSQIKLAQDVFCEAVEAGDRENVDGKDIPAVDLDMTVRVRPLIPPVSLSSLLLIHNFQLSNEFEFRVTSFHHLVPNLLKKTFGGPPTIALFASNARKKREAYRNSEFALRILVSHGIPSDHPVLNSRYLVFEAQQAHSYGLSTELALASVTTTPAKAAGLSHRVGFLSKGYDADVIVWDSHPYSIVGGTDTVICAVDGLAFNERNLLHAYRNGITKAITAPTGNGFIQGLSTEFFPGAETSLDHRAIIREEAAIHVTIGHAVDQSISTQVSALRELLFELDASVWKRVRSREVPLVINVDSADIMSTLIRLKESYKRQTRDNFDLTFVGASEAHLIAHEIAKEGISVAITMPRPYPGSWESQRILSGALLTHDGIVMKLLHASVNVGIGIVDGHSARNTRFEAVRPALNSFGEIGPWKVLALVTVNLECALGDARRHGRKVDGTAAELVVYFESRVVGVVSSERGITDLF